MSLSRAVAKRVVMATTTTGAQSPMAVFPAGARNCSVSHGLDGSTKAVTFVIEGSIGGSNVWVPVSGSIGLSTAGAIVTTTGEGVFDRFRINVSANATTGDGTATWWVMAG